MTTLLRNRAAVAARNDVPELDPRQAALRPFLQGSCGRREPPVGEAVGDPRSAAFDLEWLTRIPAGCHADALVPDQRVAGEDNLRPVLASEVPSAAAERCRLLELPGEYQPVAHDVKEQIIRGRD